MLPCLTARPLSLKRLRQTADTVKFVVAVPQHGNDVFVDGLVENYLFQDSD